MTDQFEDKHKKRFEMPLPEEHFDIVPSAEEIAQWVADLKQNQSGAHIETARSKLAHEELALYMNESATNLFLSARSLSNEHGGSMLEWIGKIENLALNMAWNQREMKDAHIALYPLAMKLTDMGKLLTEHKFGQEQFNNIGTNIKLIARVADCFMQIVPEVIEAGQVCMRYNGQGFEITVYNIAQGAHEILAEVPVTATNYKSSFATERATGASEQLANTAIDLNRLTGGSSGLNVDSVAETAMKQVRDDSDF